MRFVPANAIRTGMVNAKPLYGHNQEILLREGILLTPHHVQRIIALGYNGIYVEDYANEDIQYQEIINTELRMEAVSKIKKLFLEGAHDNSPQAIATRKKSLRITLDKLLDEILDNRHLMINMIDLKVFDDYTYYHSVNVTIIALVLGVSLGLGREELYRLGLSAMLHDVGKIMISKDILEKPGKLTPEEYDVMKTHPDEGYKYLKDVYDLPVTVYMSVRFHHEQISGNGYPLGRKGREIPLYARIISMADVFDALTSDRVYRKALSPSDATEFIMAQSGDMFDADLVKLFVRKVAPYPVGTAVLLSDHRVGVVMQNTENFGLRPMVKVVKHNTMLDAPYHLDMLAMDNLDVTILNIYQDSDIYETPDLFPDPNAVSTSD